MLNCLVHLLTLFAFVEFRALARSDSYAVWAADSVIARGQSTGLDSNGNPKVIYDDGEFQLGLRRLYDRTKDEKYYQHLLKAANTIVSDSGALPSSYKPYQDWFDILVPVGPSVFWN
ncbi:hypothetical protein WG66_002002 [Moniliophthora roreri]|nr:hypothetical protein WG66_002002 [Moniliophthora roreri]